MAVGALADLVLALAMFHEVIGSVTDALATGGAASGVSLAVEGSVETNSGGSAAEVRSLLAIAILSAAGSNGE